MKLPFSAACVSALLFGLASSTLASAEEQGAIQIVSAVYGPENATRPLNFVPRLQEACGEASNYCEVFCSNAFVGRGPHGLFHWPFEAQPVCRVTYRCGGQATMVTDAEKNDLLVLSCRRRP